MNIRRAAAALFWLGAVALMLQAGTATADQRRDFRRFVISPAICERAGLSEETQAYCDRIAGLRGRALYKATVLENLRRTNTPPVAALEYLRPLREQHPLPGRADLDASASIDDDGTIERYVFQLYDGETGQILGGPIETSQPRATFRFDHEPPASLRATLTVYDDDGAFDTTEATEAVEGTNCASTLFTCSVSSGATTCSPKSSTTSFTTGDVLAAAQICDASITKSTPLAIAAGGGAGGYQVLGGLAVMATTLANLDQTLGAPADGTTYCYGLARASISGNTGSSGGASTLLRTCQNVSQTDPTGVLLIAGGGGGTGDDASDIGGEGGFAGSTTAGPCPSDCLKVPRGNPGQGLRSDGGADGGGGGKGGSGGPSGHDGVGGEGGGVPGVGMAGWVQGEPQVTGSSGAGGTVGGNLQGGRGGGGGGYGGGGGDLGGGAGGGSFAAQSTCKLPDDYFSQGHGGDGYLSFVFNSPDATDCGSVVVKPVVDSVSKSSVPVGDPFDIDGSGFVDVTAVKLGNDTLNTNAWTVETDTQISVPQAPEPAQLNQPLAVVVETSAGTSNANVTVTITASTSLPHIDDVAPSPVTVGKTITITGTGFTGATAVQIAGSPVEGWTVNSDTTIALPAPELDSSLYGLALAVEVDTPAGASNSDVNVTIYPA